MKVYQNIEVAETPFLRGKLCIVMELLSHSLASQFPSRVRGPRHTLRLDNIQDCFLQIFSGVSYLHGEGLVHRDLKPDNVLIRTLDPIEVAIADFDSIGWHQNMVKFHGTAKYAAPELIVDHLSQPEGSNFYTNKVDIWSMGVIFCSTALLMVYPRPSARKDVLGKTYLLRSR